MSPSAKETAAIKSAAPTNTTDMGGPLEEAGTGSIAGLRARGPYAVAAAPETTSGNGTTFRTPFNEVSTVVEVVVLVVFADVRRGAARSAIRRRTATEFVGATA